MKCSVQVIRHFLSGVGIFLSGYMRGEAVSLVGQRSDRVLGRNLKQGAQNEAREVGQSRRRAAEKQCL